MSDYQRLRKQLFFRITKIKVVEYHSGKRFDNFQPGYNRDEYLINSIYNL